MPKQAVKRTTRSITPDWLKALTAWRAHGRTGLTLHALATICNRDPMEILDEMKGSAYPYAQYCNTVNAWVWSVSVNFRDVAKKDGTVAYKRSLDPRNGDLVTNDNLNDITRVFRKYPWPTYKSFRNNRGQKTLTIPDIAKEGLARVLAGKEKPLPGAAFIDGWY